MVVLPLTTSSVVCVGHISELYVIPDIPVSHRALDKTAGGHAINGCQDWWPCSPCVCPVAHLASRPGGTLNSSTVDFIRRGLQCCTRSRGWPNHFRGTARVGVTIRALQAHPTSPPPHHPTTPPTSALPRQAWPVSFYLFPPPSCKSTCSDFIWYSHLTRMTQSVQDDGFTL